MYQNHGCCTPPYSKKDDCCCKDGIICALDWISRKMIEQSTGTNNNGCISELYYYPVLPQIDETDISNEIGKIIYITPDILVATLKGGRLNGDTIYLNLCELTALEFRLSENCNENIDVEIQSRFNKIKYVSPKSCCCKNGVLEYLLNARNALPSTTGTTTNISGVIISTNDNSFVVYEILAINPDTVWAKGRVVIDADTTIDTYYVISLCDIVGIILIS